MNENNSDKLFDLFINVSYNDLPNYLKYNPIFNKKRFIYYYKFGDIRNDDFNINEIHLHDITILKLVLKYSSFHSDEIIKLIINYSNNINISTNLDISTDFDNSNDFIIEKNTIFDNETSIKYIIKNFKVIFKFILNNKNCPYYNALKIFFYNEKIKKFDSFYNNKDMIKILFKQKLYPKRLINNINKEFYFDLIQSYRLSIINGNKITNFLINEEPNEILKVLFSKKLNNISHYNENKYYINNPKFILNSLNNKKKGYYYAFPLEDIKYKNNNLGKYSILKYGIIVHDYKEINNNHNIIFMNKFVQPKTLIEHNVPIIPKKLNNKDCIIFLIKKLNLNVNKIFKLNLKDINEDILKVLKSSTKPNFLLKLIDKSHPFFSDILFRKNMKNCNIYKINLYNLIFNYIRIECDNDYFYHDYIIPKLYKYDKKILQKLSYYVPYFIRNFELKFLESNIYDSHLIDTSKVCIFKMPLNNEKIHYIKKLMNCYNINYNNCLEYLKNKELALDIITKYKYNILKLIPFHNDNNDIVLQSLKNNPEEIQYVSLRLKEEYVKCNFDLNKLIKFISNEK